MTDTTNVLEFVRKFVNSKKDVKLDRRIKELIYNTILPIIVEYDNSLDKPMESSSKSTGIPEKSIDDVVDKPTDLMKKNQQ